MGLRYLNGGGGNDTLVGHAGNDVIAGSPGFDTALFSGLRSAYVLTRSGTSLNVSGPDGSDTLISIEKLAFTDGTIDFNGHGIADFNGDGKADILWQHDNGTPAVWLMNGTGVAAMGQPLTNPGPELACH